MARNLTARDFLPLLDGASGLLLVGGQAVNIWAEKYLSIEPALAEYLPFTSRDADFFRRSKKLRIPADWKELKIPSKGRLRLVTHVLEGPHGQTAEVLRAINGLSESEIDTHALSLNHDGAAIPLLSPVALFQAKLANLNSLQQEDRQDQKHLNLLLQITRCFFEEMLTAYRGSERPKQAIEWLHVHVGNFEKAVAQKHLKFASWDTVLPVDLLRSHPSQSVVNFCDKLTDLRP